MNIKESAALSSRQIKPFFLIHLIVALLVTSFFLPITRPLWKNLDDASFHLLNHTLAWGKGWQIFWAIANHHISDWLEDAVFLFFIVYYVRKPNGKTKAQKIKECLSIILIIAFIDICINRMIFRETLKFSWPSPTLVYEDTCHRLSELVPWLVVKDCARKSFPGDHATTAALFGTLFAPLLNGKAKYIAMTYSVFLCLPRLIAGAHWLSDILLGSLGLAFLAHAWYFYSPLRFHRKKFEKKAT